MALGVYSTFPATRANGTGNPPLDADNLMLIALALGAGNNVLDSAFAGGADATGSNDSAAVFNAAVTALGASPGYVIVPPGTYKLASTVAFTNPGQYLLCAPGVVLSSFVAGDCVSMTFSGTYSGTTTRDGGVLGWPVIDGTNAPTTYAYTATNASPCVFTAAGSALANGTPVQLSGGSAPAGFTNGTQYWVVAASGTTFSLAATLGGAAVNSSSTGNGNVLPASAGLHMGDIFNLRVEAVVQHFTGTGSKGAWFDNRTHWTEGGHFRVDAISNTAGVVFDAGNGGTNSFARTYADLYVNQQTTSFDGVVLQAGATIYGGLLKIGGNYNGAAGGSGGASLRLTGSTGGAFSRITNSLIMLDNECTSGAVTAQTINFGSGSNVIATCTGVMNFAAAGNNFAASNWGGSGSFFGPIDGDTSLAGLRRLAESVTLDGGINTAHSAGAQALSNGSTITVASTMVQVSNAGAVTGIILTAGSFDGQEVTVVNVSAGTVTFAASGTSHVSGGVSVALGAATSATPGRRFQWIAAQSLWFAC